MSCSGFLSLTRHRRDCLQLLHALAHLLDLALQAFGFGLQVCGLGAISGIERIQITLDALFKFTLAPLNLAWRVVALPVIDDLELAASISGFTGEGLFAFGRGKKVICMDGFDLFETLDRELPLNVALDRKVRRAAETGLHFERIRDLLPR